MTQTARTRLRTLPILLGTLLVVALEMALLTGVWHLGDDVERQEIAASHLSGVLAPLTPASAATSTDALRGAVRDLRAAGVDTAAGSPGAAAVAAVETLAAAPTEPNLVRARAAGADLGAALGSAQTVRAWQAAAAHGTLLVVASVGWFVWFRRLVDRHRTVERALTQRTVVDQRERRLLALVQNSADLIVVIEPDGSLSFVSPSCHAVLGHDADGLVGHPLADLVGEESVVVGAMLAAAVPGDQPVLVRPVHADGRTVVLEGTLTNLLDDPTVAGWVLTLHDVTERHALADELAHQAFHDSLTGLANRALFSDRLDHALLRRRAGSDVAVLFLDLDDFKDVNDTQGHSVGDRLLVVAAERLRTVLQASDTPARLGGDEFAVLLEDTDAVAAREVAQRVLAALSTPVELEGVLWAVRASLGIATAGAEETTGEQLLRNADVAMYWAKEEGGGGVALYDRGRHAASLEEVALLNELTRAIEHGELVLHYQPTVDLTSNATTGFEALVRWDHPERGLLFPGEFVPAAERSGLVVRLGSWVIREACRAAMVLDPTATGPTMAVNISARHLLRPDFVDEVASVLRESHLPAQRLVVEVTESVLVDDFGTAERALRGLRDLGVWIAIDDFGTGYSSLSYLSQLPVDILKIDKSFVDRVCAEDHAASVTLAILEMSRSLRLTTVAEGVETDEQASWLAARECARAQGYLWSAAVPVEAAAALLAAGEGGRPVAR